MKKINLTLAPVFILMILFSSCATLFAPSSHSLSVSSEPNSAEVYVNGFKMGHTPIQLSLKADKSYSIEFRKEGFQTITKVVNTKVGAGWVILDIIAGLVPIVVDAATGAWNKLDQDAVNASLVKQQ
ncbi:MAG: PEGA domain-containing protein [Saprospiraceae bacterium]|jgi:hypothetical protein|nr:PEGA domain-containing protein [Saprospiraceae bacterium]